MNDLKAIKQDRINKLKTDLSFYEGIGDKEMQQHIKNLIEILEGV